MESEKVVTSRALLKKAKSVGVREAQAKLSRLVESSSPAIITSHGIPKSFLISYYDMLEILDVLEELKDRRLIEEIAGARKEYEEGFSVPAERLFKKLGF